MKDLIRMVVVLTVISACSGGILAGVKQGTEETIERVLLINEKAPAIMAILQGVTNDPLEEKFKLPDKDEEKSFFVGNYADGKKVVVFESSANGFEAAIGVMVGVDLESDKLVGIGVTTHSETPGIGSKAKTDPFLRSQFKGLALADGFKVKKDGGQIDAIGGATITSRGVCAAVTGAGEVYKRLKSEIQKKVQ